MAFILEDSAAAAQPRYVMEDAPVQPKSFKQMMLERETNDLSSGVRRGVKDVLDTGAQGLAWLYDKATGGDEAGRVAAMNEQGKADYNAQPVTAGSFGGRILGNLLATTPAVTAIGAGLGATGVPALQAVGNAVTTGGATTGQTLPRVADLAARTVGGAVNGYVTTGLVDPSAANKGAVLGAVTPGVVQAGGWLGQQASDGVKALSRRLMQSAVKPTIAQLKSGDAATAIDTMLQNGISPNQKGVDKLQTLIDATDQKISSAVANSTATIDKGNTLGPVLDTRAQFGAQVSPASDLQSIDGAISGYLNHPTYPGMTLPVQDAQALKQGTYRVLAKKYGQMGSADTEAQKAIARGLKDEIANAVPGIAQDNATLSDYLATLEVARRRALMSANNNPLGLAAIAPSKAGLLAFLADRSTELKALGARGLYSTSGMPGMGLGLLSSPGASPLLRGGLLAVEANP